MIQNEDNPENSVLRVLISSLTELRGQVKQCQNLFLNLFEKGESPCTKEFPYVKIKINFLITISKLYVVSHHIMESTQEKSDHQMHFMTDISFKLKF